MSHRDNEQVEMLKDLRHLVVDAEPTEAHRAAAFAALDDAIASETGSSEVVPFEKKRRRSWRFRVGAIAAAAAAIAVIGGGILATNQPLTATGLNEVVQVIEPLPPESFTGASLERRTHYVHYWNMEFSDGTRIVATQEVEYVERVGDDGLIERITTWHDPVAEDPSEQDELMELMTEDRPWDLGVDTVVYPPHQHFEYLPETVEGWDEKLRGMYDTYVFMAHSDAAGTDPTPPRTYEFYALENITSVYHSQIPTGPQRSAMVNFLASLPNLDSVEEPDKIAFTADWGKECCVSTYSATFDRDGWMIADSSVFHEGGSEYGIVPGSGGWMTRTPWYEISDE